MKKLIAMAALVLSTTGAFAQYSAGDVTLQPKVGLNISSVTDCNGDYRAGFAVGVEGEYHVSPLVGISVGALYSQEGVKGDIEGVDTKITLDYINVPILANFYVAKGLALKAGVQPGFNVRKSVKTGDVTVDLENHDNLVKTVDFSIPVGLSYEYQNICLDARYNIGVTNLAKEVEGKGSVFQITLGYKFAL